MAKDDDKGIGGKPNNDDTEGLKKSLEAALAAQKEAENQVKAMRVEMAKVKKDDDASKSEMDKVSEKLAELEKRAAEADARALRAEVAQAKKLTPAQAKRLQGSTREELEADADELAEAFGAKPDEGADNGRGGPKPKPKVRPEPSASDNDEQIDYGKVAESVLGNG